VSIAFYFAANTLSNCDCVALKYRFLSWNSEHPEKVQPLTLKGGLSNGTRKHFTGDRLAGLNPTQARVTFGHRPKMS